MTNTKFNKIIAWSYAAIVIFAWVILSSSTIWESVCIAKERGDNWIKYIGFWLLTIPFINKAIWAIICTKPNFKMILNNDRKYTNVYVLWLHVWQYIWFIPFFVYCFVERIPVYLEIFSTTLLLTTSVFCVSKNLYLKKKSS